MIVEYWTLVNCDSQVIIAWFIFYVFVGSFIYFPTNILRDIYAHTHRVFYGGIKKTTACSESPTKGGK